MCADAPMVGTFTSRKQKTIIAQEMARPTGPKQRVYYVILWMGSARPSTPLVPRYVTEPGHAEDLKESALSSIHLPEAAIQPISFNLRKLKFCLASLSSQKDKNEG